MTGAWSRHRQNDVTLRCNAGFLRGVAAGLMDSGGLGVALPCASAKRSRLFPKVFDDCSCVGRGLSSHNRAIIRELNETVFAINFLETGVIGCSGSFEKVGVLHLVHRPVITSTSLCLFCDF